MQRRGTALALLVVGAGASVAAGVDWYGDDLGRTYAGPWSGAVLLAAASAVVLCGAASLRRPTPGSVQRRGVAALVFAVQGAALLAGLGEGAPPVRAGAIVAGAAVAAAALLAAGSLLPWPRRGWVTALGAVLLVGLTTLLVVGPPGSPEPEITIIR